jgi:hypothetical protein
LSPILRITCDNPAVSGIVFRPEYKRDGDASWTPVVVAAEIFTADTAALPPGTYSVRARFTLNGALYNLGTALTGIAVEAAVPAPVPPVSFTAIHSIGTVTLQATSPNDVQHKALRFWRTTVNTFTSPVDVSGQLVTAANVVSNDTDAPAPGNYWYWATSEFNTSSRSTPAGPVAVTVT